MAFKVTKEEVQRRDDKWRLGFEPGNVIVVDGREHTVKKVRGRFVEFEDGTEMQFIYRVASSSVSR